MEWPVETSGDCPECGHWPFPGKHGEGGCAAAGGTCGCTHGGGKLETDAS